MFGGMNPSKMQGMMKKMGISQSELPVKRVIFEMEDKNMIIEDPSVVKVNMQGNVMYQVSGEESEEEASKFSDEDVLMVAKQTEKSEEEARTALEGSEGDIAEAIMALKS